MIPEKENIFHKYFDTVQDKGGYISCSRNGQKRAWMYDKKLINLFSTEKLEKLISNQVLS